MPKNWKKNHGKIVHQYNDEPIYSSMHTKCSIVNSWPRIVDLT